MSGLNPVPPAEQPPEGTPQQATQPMVTQPPNSADLSAAQLLELQDEAKQTEYRRQFLLQMQHRSCPGCGDS
jgi:hypothetical protein